MNNKFKYNFNGIVFHKFSEARLLLSKIFDLEQI